MAAQSITIRLALTDGGKVKAELANIGASGQKALERIRDASVPASRGLQLIDAAGSVLHGKFEEMARDSGLLGEALQKIGPGGVAVASAIGAVVVALDQIASHTERAIEYLGKLAVESEQLGISAKAMQELTYTFRQAGVSAEDATGILVKFNTTLGQAMRDPASVSKQTAKAFSDLGISQQDVVEHGDDMNYMLRRLADGLAHSKSQAEATADAKELLGKRAAALLPILREGAEALDEEAERASKAGAVVDDALVKKGHEAHAALEALSQVMDAQNAKSFAEFGEDLVQIKQFIADVWITANNLIEILKTDLGNDIFRQLLIQNMSILGPMSEVWNMAKDIYHWATGTGGGHGATGSWEGPEPPKPKEKPLAPGHWDVLDEKHKKTDAEKEAEEIEKLIAKAHLEAEAEERLAKAAGISSAALRQAANDNKVAAFEHDHGAAAAARYRVEIERTSTAEQQRQLTATVLGLTQQADAAQRLAAVSGQGAAAVHRLTIENQAFAEALKFGAEGSRAFTIAYARLLEQLQRKDSAAAAEAFAQELLTHQQTLQVSQLELSLMDQAAGKRAELVASVQEELRLRQQFPGLTQEQIDQLTQLSAADAKVKAQIKEREEAEHDFAQIARQGIADVVSGLKEVVTQAKTWQEALLGVAQSLGTLAEQQLVEKPLSKAIDRWFSGESASNTTAGAGAGAGKGDFGMIGEWASSGWSWLNDAFGFGDPAQQATTQQQQQAAGQLTKAAGALGQSGAAGQLGTAGKALGTMPGIFQSVLGSMVGTMTINAALVNVNGGAAGAGAGAGAGGGVAGQAFSWFSSLFGSGTATDTGVSAGAAPSGSMGGYEMGGSSTFLVARGAAFEGGNVIPFARGGVVERPTLFPMARGMGLMGEAGPEAVLPLRRLPSGRLGVESGGGSTGQTRGGGGHTVSINVVVNGGDQATADRFRRTAAQAARDALLVAEEHKRRFG